MKTKIPTSHLSACYNLCQSVQCACVSKLSKNCCARQACFLAGLLARFCTDSQLFFAHSVKGSCFQGRSDGDVRTIRIRDWRLWERRKSSSEIVKMWKDWNGGIKYIWEVWFSESDGNGGFCSRQSCSAADLMEVGEEEDWAVRGENITQVPLLDFQSLSCLPLSQNQQCALSMMIITIRRGMGTAPSSLTGMEPQMQLHFHWCVPFFSPSDDRTLIQSVVQNKNVNTQVPPLPAYIAYTSFVLFRFHLFSFYWCFTVANEVCGNCLMKGWSDV